MIEATLRREILEEIGLEVEASRLLRIDAVPYVPEEPGPYRLDFYFRSIPERGFAALRDGLELGTIAPRSPEVKQIRLVPLTELERYDLYSSDAQFLRRELPKVEPTLADTAPDREDNAT